jgi:regulator of RNase E activity RraA
MEAIRRFDVCTIANAIETFGVRPANEGFADASIRCLAPVGTRMLGYAATARVKGCSLTITGQRYDDREGWWEYLSTLPAPSVVVLQDVDDRPGFGSFLGEVHSSIYMRLGCIGAITNGAARDLPAVEALGFPIFAGGVAVSHCYMRLVEFGEPVEVGGLQVAPGDLLYGDCHGIISIPKPVSSQLAAAAARLVEGEQRIVDFCRSPDFSIERLRSLVRAKS